MAIELTYINAESKCFQRIQRFMLYIARLPILGMLWSGLRFARTPDKDLDFALYPMIEAKYDMRNFCWYRVGVSPNGGFLFYTPIVALRKPL